jgi:hypothetical protein
VDSIAKDPTHFCYSKDASDRYHSSIIAHRVIQNTKILNNPKLKKFIRSQMSKQSLKALGGRSKIE